MWNFSDVILSKKVFCLKVTVCFVCRRCLKSSIHLSAKIMKEESNSRFIIKLVLILPWTKSVCFRGCTLEWQVLIIKLSNIGNDTEQWINYFIVSLLLQRSYMADGTKEVFHRRHATDWWWAKLIFILNLIIIIIIYLGRRMCYTYMWCVGFLFLLHCVGSFSLLCF